jgi:hypothetical protein
VCLFLNGIASCALHNGEVRENVVQSLMDSIVECVRQAKLLQLMDIIVSVCGLPNLLYS